MSSNDDNSLNDRGMDDIDLAKGIPSVTTAHAMGAKQSGRWEIIVLNVHWMNHDYDYDGTLYSIML